ncbi:hypothetical protein GWI33_007709 [Rhynchophorus ferrugineus]|uniref:Uncharacterized protein n=1 Tax=Rhynchophorus ferrugineus TaxID=354439 RepID=A0A834ID66_RHYFE|nr:hypothetical protein GWI33_007709 [Rhynchophorus ferrugineus]
MMMTSYGRVPNPPGSRSFAVYQADERVLNRPPLGRKAVPPNDRRDPYEYRLLIKSIGDDPTQPLGEFHDLRHLIF